MIKRNEVLTHAITWMNLKNTMLTIAKCWKQPKSPSVNEWIKTLWYIYTMEYDAVEIKGAPTLCDRVNGTGEHYAK